MTEMEKLLRRLDVIRKAKIEAIKDQNFELAANKREEEKDLLKEIEALRQGIIENGQKQE